MNYIGRKAKLINFIKNTILENSKNRNTFCDLFAGTGVVGENFKPYFNKIISNDFEYYAFVLNKHYLNNNNYDDKEFSFINSLEPIRGLIYNNYCSIAGRMFFSDYNGQKIDAIRQYIEKHEGDYFYFLLTCLLEAVDRVQNTTGLYAAYLKKLKSSAEKEITLLAEQKIIVSGQENEVYNEDANTLIKRINGDVLYLDPPYNRRQYGANYHLLNTIARYELPEGIELSGVAGLPKNYKKSKMCYVSTAYNALEDIINKANFTDIFLSYNSEGILTKEDIKDIMSRYGEYEYFTIKYKRYQSQKESTHDSVIEYLHHLRKVK